MNKAQLVEAVLHLPRQDRAEVITTVLRSLDGQMGEPELTQGEWERAWGDELDRRIEQLETGEVTAIPGEQVFERLRARLSELKREG